MVELVVADMGTILSPFRFNGQSNRAIFFLLYQVFLVCFVVSQYHRCAVEEKRRITSSVCSLVDSFLDIK